MNVKPEQANLVLSILESANCGPTTIDSMLLWDKETEEAGRAHLEFVVEQLLVSGCMTYTGDKRLITTQQGELHIRLVTQHVA
ncbi:MULTISPECIES: hypothetical protein [Vibrio]|jgi:hypothetical protein|uniref:Uncharacterized protein n=1 Tax=Vibrio europaeus TaxID=300876 RepID=A0ABT5GMW2_9VIBR|nr:MULTISPECIES: hypothetical protein [Vibrio]QXM18764.1 hypothetical protein [Vibrio phage ST2-1pr]MCY9805547.1 hypothetical protein [Vibrio scophthalmi]MDC5718283.1 hypothetical protein [Vibrio europaeus]MDC5723110.1 hypothetical protein [Vibrio europaeus]MDC5728067.1 hypothetical protein [Vibrio europaeus]